MIVLEKFFQFMCFLLVLMTYFPVPHLVMWRDTTMSLVKLLNHRWSTLSLVRPSARCQVLPPSPCSQCQWMARLCIKYQFKRWQLCIRATDESKGTWYKVGLKPRPLFCPRGCDPAHIYILNLLVLFVKLFSMVLLQPNVNSAWLEDIEPLWNIDRKGKAKTRYLADGTYKLGCFLLREPSGASETKPDSRLFSPSFFTVINKNDIAQTCK